MIHIIIWGAIGLISLTAGCATVSMGDKAPDWNLVDIQGQEHSLSDYSGQVVILDFWATWCAPCHPASEHLQSLYEQYGDRGMSILALHYGDKGDAAAYAREHGYTYTFFPNGLTIATKYSVSKIPTLIVIDRSGRVVHRRTGFSKGDAESLTAIVEQLLLTGTQENQNNDSA